MHRNLRSGFARVVVVLAAGCQKGPEASPPLPPPAASAPSAASSAASAASAPGTASSAVSAPPALAPAPSYPMCGGQTQAAAEAARGGAVNAQLAPAFLDQMSA